MSAGCAGAQRASMFCGFFCALKTPIGGVFFHAHQVPEKNIRHVVKNTSHIF